MAAGILGSPAFLFSRTPVLGLPVYALILVSAAALLCAALFFLCLYVSRHKHPPVLLRSSAKQISKTPSTAAKENNTVAAKAASVPLEAKKPSEGSPGKSMGNIGWRRWYALAELEAATAGFSPRNVVGRGGYGIVYRGVLPDRTMVAIKDLLNNKGQAENEFKMEVEAMGRVRHKNLVRLIGHCVEGPKRMLVYEYVDNGTLEQWLHGDVGTTSPLTWDIRMNIAIGTAKGIAYLHEGLEPKVVHRDIKSSNILLDKHWNPKVSDFGMAKLLGSGSSFVTTRVMGTFGYVAPDYACTGLLNESNDVYSFGVLLMEIISGRIPVDYSRPVGEVNMVEWFKRAVQSKRDEEVIDALIAVKPAPRSLKRMMLICLRCVDMDAQSRPKMGQIVHMLEGEEFPFRVEHRLARQATLCSCQPNPSPSDSGRFKGLGS